MKHQYCVLVTGLLGWTLWHDVGIYHSAGNARLGGPNYAVRAYDTEAACLIAQREAMANEEEPRRGPLTEQVVDGILVWDANRQHYTTFLYRCTPTSADAATMPRRR